MARLREQGLSSAPMHTLLSMLRMRDRLSAEQFCREREGSHQIVESSVYDETREVGQGASLRGFGGLESGSNLGRGDQRNVRHPGFWGVQHAEKGLVVLETGSRCDGVDEGLRYLMDDRICGQEKRGAVVEKSPRALVASQRSDCGAESRQSCTLGAWRDHIVEKVPAGLERDGGGADGGGADGRAG